MDTNTQNPAALLFDAIFELRIVYNVFHHQVNIGLVLVYRIVYAKFHFCPSDPTTRATVLSNCKIIDQNLEGDRTDI